MVRLHVSLTQHDYDRLPKKEDDVVYYALSRGHGSSLIRDIRAREYRRSQQQRIEAERSRLLPLPERPYENFKPVRVKVDRYQTVRVDCNRYSVPRGPMWVAGCGLM